MNYIKSIAVFCGSSDGNDYCFGESAFLLGKILAQKKITLVYGAGVSGIMGCCAKGCALNGGHVIGVIPKFLYDVPGVKAGDIESELIVTSDMHERKKRMSDISDAFIALPGGIGTFDEIFEQIAWLQLGIHRKPCGFLNTNGFCDKLFAFLDNCVGKGFVKQSVLSSVQCSSKPEDLVSMLCSVSLDWERNFQNSLLKI